MKMNFFIMSSLFFVKSFEDDFVLKTVEDKEKVAAQSIHDILKRKRITPNTNSFDQNKRLACTNLSLNYPQTYREQGLIFRTREKPNHIYPFDLAVLTKNNDLVVDYYKIENDLDVYYNHTLIEGYKEFLFKNVKSMLKAIPSPQFALLLGHRSY